MDPVTQGALGAVAAQAICGRRLPSAWLIGWASGMAADLDVLIQPASDPLNGLSYHRHFTHSLAFAPIGGLLCALPLLLFPRWRGKWWLALAASLIGYFTHGLLDAFTAFGTLLYWPFSHERVAWDFIGIIDPVYTGVLILGLILAVRWRRPRLATAALLISSGYMALGGWQHHRAEQVQAALAAARGDQVVHGRCMPTPLNLVVWRSVYVADGRIQQDALHVPWFGRPTVEAGKWTPLETVATLEQQLGPLTEQERRAFDRFAWFADGFTARNAGDPGLIGDMRYGMDPNRFTSLWGLVIPDQAGEPLRFRRFAIPRRAALHWMWTTLIGTNPKLVPLAVLQSELARRNAAANNVPVSAG